MANAIADPPNQQMFSPSAGFIGTLVSPKQQLCVETAMVLVAALQCAMIAGIAAAPVTFKAWLAEFWVKHCEAQLQTTEEKLQLWADD